MICRGSFLYLGGDEVVKGVDLSQIPAQREPLPAAAR